MNCMLLDEQTFQTIIESTPLISIDLIVKNHQGQALLGKRKNPPAKNFWFVVGGRILKNETLAEAFTRLTLQELGKAISLNDANFIAPYQHFYKDSVFNKSVSTHYVVLAYELFCDTFDDLPLKQHDSYRWFNIDELLNSKQVHQYTKDYFKESGYLV